MQIVTPMDEDFRIDPDGTVVTATYTSPVLDMGYGFAPAEMGLPMTLVMYITALTMGGATITHKVQQSPDNSTWTDVVPSTAITAAVGGQMLPGFFIKMRYVQHIITITGGSPSMTFGSILARIVR